MPNQLGMLLLRYIKIVPGGMLVFLPKYSLINRVMQAGAYNRSLVCST
jgi:Fanconi anemia group J protein